MGPAHVWQDGPTRVGAAHVWQGGPTRVGSRAPVVEGPTTVGAAHVLQAGLTSKLGGGAARGPRAGKCTVPRTYGRASRGPCPCRAAPACKVAVQQWTGAEPFSNSFTGGQLDLIYSPARTMCRTSARALSSCKCASESKTRQATQTLFT